MDISKNFDYPENDFERQLSANFGHAIRVLASCDRRTEALQPLGIHLWPAVRLNQIGFLYNSKGSPVAFATWAFVTDEVAQSMLADPNYNMDISEWNEGDQLWLVDFVAPFGEARNLMRKLCTVYLPGAWRVRGIRRYSKGKQPRVVDFKRKAA
ncbi:MAG TPA: toxin-activating lysine-acyltransferase [Steroidobacteraceae bacterium]|nr:toxin-activating lysine-acyltransferase [Steroidobacteraceae bacterium]